MNADYSSLERRNVQRMANQMTWAWTDSSRSPKSTVSLSATERVERLRKIKAEAVLTYDESVEVRMIAYGLGISLDLPWPEIIDHCLTALTPKYIAERLLK